MAKRIPADAFDAYFALGPDRSYEALARKFGVSKKGITLMAKRESWQQRILELEARARVASDQKRVESIEQRNERHLTALRFIQSRAVEALKKMPIQGAMDAVRAYNMSLRDERVILGEPSDRTELSIDDKIRREYERWMISQPEESKAEEPPDDDETEDAE